MDTDSRRTQIILALIFVCGFLLTTFAGWQLWSGLRADAMARSEYADLRDSIDLSDLLPSRPDTSNRPGAPTRPDPPAPSPDAPPPDPEPVRVDMSHLIEQNPDFVGWILIEGTTIDYPVVQGPDNDAYLHTTFRGERNPAGSIFMDYRAASAFDTPIAMLYGHNMRDGSMFAPLTGYVSREFLDEHPEIIIVTAEGEILTYQVFGARWTHAWDDVYVLDFNDADEAFSFFRSAPLGASRFLVLSTCADGGDRHARLLIYAALIEAPSML